MKRGILKPSTVALKRCGFLKTAKKEVGAVVKIKRAMKSSQRAVTAEEKALWDRLAQLGCVACYKDGIFNPHVSIHHVEGRTKPDCHKKVLPLCAGHHQDGAGNDKSLIAVHPYKARFEAKYGTQEYLMRLCEHRLCLVKQPEEGEVHA